MDRLIALEPVEADLTPERVDERLAAGWFPWQGRWMTCRAWPMEAGPLDTIWLRVRLAVRPPSDRQRRLAREACTVAQCDAPVFDEEHQLLYERFREKRHPDWTKEAADLVRAGTESPFLPRIREIAMRDASGRLIAYRWFLHGGVAIAGLTSIYDTARDGLGTIARTLADDWAASAGCTWSYPGYVFPGAKDHWFYKIKRGRTEWLDSDRRYWRAWDGDGPRPEDLALAEMRRRLSLLGTVEHYPGWALPHVDPSSRSLASPYFVRGAEHGGELTLTVWSLSHNRYEELRVVRNSEAPSEESEDDIPERTE